MIKEIKKKAVNSFVSMAARKTGLSAKAIETDMYNARHRKGISNKTYLRKKLYLKSPEEIKDEFGPKDNRKRTDLDVELVAEIKGISYKAARAEMEAIRKAHDVLYREYVFNRLFECETADELEKRLKRIAERKEKYIREVCADTGWSEKKTRSEISRIRGIYDISYKQYARGRFFAMSDDEIAEKLRQWQENANYFVDAAAEQSGWSRRRVRRHMKRCDVLYNIIKPYYVLYRCWELTDEEIDSYARQKNSVLLHKKLNDPRQARVLAQKHLFDEVYAEYTGRRFWINRDSSFEEFCEFAEGIDSVFCKPIESGGGLGTEKYEVTEDLRGLYELLTGKERLLVEECIKQHPEIDGFVPGCCCTVRVVVLRDSEGIHVICAGMRFGHDGITDNFSHDGMVADVDVETGVIVTDAVDKKGRIYEKHPVSGKAFKGFRIPNWELVREVAEKAMDVQPGINYVGWDVAICEDKAVLVEGNAMPDLVLVQAPYAPVKKGMKYLFDPWLNK